MGKIIRLLASWWDVNGLSGFQSHASYTVGQVKDRHYSNMLIILLLWSHSTARSLWRRFFHLQTWSANNKLQITCNMDKTKGIVSRRSWVFLLVSLPHHSHYIPHIEQIMVTKFLGTCFRYLYYCTYYNTIKYSFSMLQCQSNFYLIPQFFQRWDFFFGGGVCPHC